jgi:hypothetical protein
MGWWMDMKMVYVKGSIFMFVWIWVLFSKRGDFGSAMVAAIVLGAHEMLVHGDIQGKVEEFFLAII